MRPWKYSRPRSISARPVTIGRARRALHAQVGPRRERRQVVVDAQRARGAHAQVQLRPRIERGRLARRQRAADPEQLRGDVVTPGVERLPHVDRAGDPLPLAVAEQAKLRVEQAARALGVAQRETAPDRPDVVRGEPPLRRRRPGPRPEPPPASVPLTSSSSAALSVKRTRPCSPSMPCGKPRTRRPAPSRSSVPTRCGALACRSGRRSGARRPLPRIRRVSAESARRSARPRARSASGPSPTRSATPATSRSVPSPARWKRSRSSRPSE